MAPHSCQFTQRKNYRYGLDRRLCCPTASLDAIVNKNMYSCQKSNLVSPVIRQRLSNAVDHHTLPPSITAETGRVRHGGDKKGFRTLPEIKA